MARGGYGVALRHVRVLFDAGVAGGLTDEQLLERFRAGNSEGAELAFTVLVERHGPMVLRVCRRTLRDEHEAQDAFQATFLVLVRKAGSLRAGNTLGPWLHAVACRVASCARATAARRRAHERKAAERATSRAGTGDRGGDDLGQVLHEEIDRLPEAFRTAVVLCDLEGLTQEQAARQLGWPPGTVRSRLARGRGRLQARLIRRGLAPAAGTLASLLNADAAHAGLPAALAESAVLAATGRGAGATASTATLTNCVLRAMLMTKLKWITAALLAIGAGASGTAAIALQPSPGRPAGPAVRTIAQAEAPPRDRAAEAGLPVVYDPLWRPSETPPRDRAAEVEDKDKDEIARLERELQRAKDRLDWAERMYKKGYVSRAQMLADLQEFEQARSALWLARKRQGEHAGDRAVEGGDSNDPGLLAAEIRAKQAELRSWEAQLKHARAAEASKSLLRDRSDAEWKLAEAEVAAASATCDLKRAQLRVLELRSAQAQRRSNPR